MIILTQSGNQIFAHNRTLFVFSRVRIQLIGFLLNVKNILLLDMLLLFVLRLQLSYKFINDNPEHQGNTRYLHKISGMLIEYYAKSNSKNFSTCYDERDKVLFELLDHTIHKHLSNGA